MEGIEAPEGAAAPQTQVESLCLDFSNTVDWRDGDQPEDFITSYRDLVYWGRRMGLLSEEGSRRLLEEAALHPADAAVALVRAIDLRETIYRAFSAIAQGARPREEDLATLNAALSASLARLRIVPSQDSYSWGWAASPSDLDQMLWPVVRSAGILLTSVLLGRVRKCAGDPCGWLFLDTSKNRSRRWCDMRSCGNRAKARRYYQRKRSPRHLPS